MQGKKGLARRTAIGCVVASALAATVWPACAQERSLDIPAQDASTAVASLARQMDVQVLLAARDASGRRTHTVHGAYSPEEALDRMLRGSGLEARRLRADIWIVVPAPPSPGVGDDAAAQSVAEVIVTAQKKTERLLDVPVPVTSIRGAALVADNQTRIQDYFSSFPGLDYTPYTANQNYLTIRGIANGVNALPTTGVTLDDAPVSFAFTYNGFTLNPDPGDLASVEVLRGPQGTLYGASSMGGLLKYVTVAPSTVGFSGRMEVGANYVQNGAEPGYDVRAAANIPVSDNLAFRVSGFTRQDAGYIDNTFLNEKGINKAENYGGLLSALWKPTSNISLKVNALLQDTRVDGLTEEDAPTSGFPQTAGLRNFQQSYVANVGPGDNRFAFYSANLNVKLGAISLTSITSYSTQHNTTSEDATYAFGSFGPEGSGEPLLQTIDSRKFTQELRLFGVIWNRIDWQLGGFYTAENSHQVAIVPVENATTGAKLAPDVFTDDQQTIYRESAVFGSINYHFDGQFSIQAGLRDSIINEPISPIYRGGSLFGGTVLTMTTPPDSANAITFLVTPKFQVSKDVMVYARVASGYQPGGPNNSGLNVPPEFRPSTTVNYEVGSKVAFIGQKVVIDASLYYIDWQDIQISEVAGGIFGYTGNAGAAKSEGVEFSVQLKPWRGFSFDGWTAYDDAVLTKAFPADSTTYAVAGDRLPLSARYSAHGSVEQEFPISEEISGYAKGVVSYIGDRVGTFQSQTTPERQILPAYTKTDLYAGIRLQAWTFETYVTNVANVRGMLNGGIGYAPSYAFVYIQPRTAGVRLSTKF